MFEVTEDKGHAVAGYFVLKKGAYRKFRFNLLARNGQVVVTSGPYGSKAAAIRRYPLRPETGRRASIEDQTTKELVCARRRPEGGGLRQEGQ